jgi:membrane protein CcdC involved in cytochrome C biogenesis
MLNAILSFISPFLNSEVAVLAFILLVFFLFPLIKKSEIDIKNEKIKFEKTNLLVFILILLFFRKKK